MKVVFDHLNELNNPNLTYPMKKRYHTYQIDREVSPISQLSSRAYRGRTRGLRPAMVAPVQQDEVDYSMKLEDELTNRELKGFAFGCIESLTQLASSATNQNIQTALVKLAQEKLTSFVALINERNEAKTEFKQFVKWSHKFAASAQSSFTSEMSIANDPKLPSQQTLQCVEQSMGAQFRMDALAERITYLTSAIPAFVNTAGEELGFPRPITQKIAQCVKKALSKIAQ